MNKYTIEEAIASHEAFYTNKQVADLLNCDGQALKKSILNNPDSFGFRVLTKGKKKKLLYPRQDFIKAFGLNDYKTELIPCNTKLDTIKSLNTLCITPEQASSVVHMSPSDIRLYAQYNPSLLPFPTFVLGKRTKIPRIPFIKVFENQEIIAA